MGDSPGDGTGSSVNRTTRFDKPLPLSSAVQQIRVYDEPGNVIETHEHAGDFKEW